MYYIRSQNRDIFDELVFNGKGYYPDASNGTFFVNTNMITYSRVTTDKVVGGYIAFSSYTTGYFYMTFWDVKQQQIKTEKCTISNGLYYVKTAPYNADWVSLSFYNDQKIKEINKVGETYPLDAVIKHEQELNGDERIEVDIHYTDNNRKFLAYHEDLNMWLIEFEGKEYVIVSNTKKGYGDYQMVSCTAILYALFKLNTDRIYERYDEHLTVTEGLTLVFSGTPFTYINVGNAASEQFEGLGEGETRLEVLKTLIDRWGYEIKIVGDVFYFYDQVGNDSNFEYRYKINASDIEQASDANEMYTYARGYGDYSDDVAETTDETTDTTETSDIPITEKANLKREYTSPLAKYIGKLHAPPIQDGRITKVETMDQKLYDLVENSITITFTANIVDMRENGYEYQSAVLGDRVFLVDERINVDREIRVIKIDRTLDANGNIIDMEITFGTDSLTDKYEAQFNTAIKDINDILSGRKVIPFQSLDVVSRSMVNKIQNTSSELVFDDMGIHAIDKKNANNIVTMNSSGWMLSTDGGTTAKTALTAEGIVADSITTGVLNTQLVKVIGTKNYFYIDGDMLVAKDPNSKSETTLTPTGLNITRPDGAVYMVNGVPRMSLEVQSRPMAYHTVEFEGMSYKTNYRDYQYFEYFYAEHKARYLVISYAVSWANESENAVGWVSAMVQEFGQENNRQVTQKTYVTKEGGEVFENVTIDLGVPTYTPLQFYLLFKNDTSNSGNIAKIRTTRIHMKG